MLQNVERNLNLLVNLDNHLVLYPTPPRGFSGGHSNVSRLSLYTGHVNVYAWDREVKQIFNYDFKY